MMNAVLERHLILAIDRRCAVFKTAAQSGKVLQEEMQKRSLACLISDILQPCCCMVCNKATLIALLAKTELCHNQQELIMQLATLIYDDLA